VIDRRASAENESSSDGDGDNDDTLPSHDSTTPSTISPPVVDLEIHDIEGIGPTTAKKLKEAGIVSVMDLAVASSEDLAIDINTSKESAATFVIGAQRLLRDYKVIDKEFLTADAALEKRKAMLRCSTGSRALDELFLGGIETQAVTEFYGEFGSGKSQICHTLCATARQSIDSGGMDSAVCKVYNSSHLELIVKDLGGYVNEFKAKLVIIDSIISLHRAEFLGRGTLANRQQKLNGMLHKLIRLAEIFNIAVVITNQVQSSPDTFFGDPTKAAGGNILGHSSTYRIYLRKSGENRVAKMMDSPYHPYSDTRFTLNEKGTDDIEEEGLKKDRTNSKRRVDNED
jgi:DNA repair protein RadA